MATSRNIANRPPRRRAWSWLVCAALIASLWRAPVPWIHTHQSFAAQTISATSRTRHLHLYHSHDGDEDFGWHVHLTFPWDVLDEPCGRQTPDSPEPTCAYEMPFVASAPSADNLDASASSFAPQFTLVETGTADRVHGMISLVSGLHFLETYSPRVPLRALLCVARC
jgi:hypothetical protein